MAPIDFHDLRLLDGLEADEAEFDETGGTEIDGADDGNENDAVEFADALAVEDGNGGKEESGVMVAWYKLS